MLVVGRGRLKSQRFGVAHDLGNGKEAGHVERRFLAKLELVVEGVVFLNDLVELIGTRRFLGAAYLAFAAVVGSHGEMPVVENVVEAGEVACRRFGGAVRIATFVHPPVLTQAVGTARGGNELPHAHGVGAGHGHGIVSAFQIGEIGEIFGESAGTEHALGVVQIGNAVSAGSFPMVPRRSREYFTK